MQHSRLYVRSVASKLGVILGWIRVLKTCNSSVQFGVQPNHGKHNGRSALSKSTYTPDALSLGVERQIIGLKISALVIHMWHAHSKRLDAAFKIHNTLVKHMCLYIALCTPRALRFARRKFYAVDVFRA